MSAILPVVLTGGASTTVILGGLAAFARTTLRRLANEVVHAAVEKVGSDVTDLKVKLAAETGGNSNGLRQAVNEIRDDITEIKVDVATLKATIAPPKAAPAPGSVAA